MPDLIFNFILRGILDVHYFPERKFSLSKVVLKKAVDASLYSSLESERQLRPATISNNFSDRNSILKRRAIINDFYEGGNECLLIDRVRGLVA